MQQMIIIKKVFSSVIYEQDFTFHWLYIFWGEVPSIDTNWEFYGYFKLVLRVSQGVFQRCVKGVSMVFQGCFKVVSRVFQENVEIVFRVFQECFRMFQGYFN